MLLLIIYIKSYYDRSKYHEWFVSMIHPLGVPPPNVRIKISYKYP